MEDIKISEQESLELINRMIQQTKKDSAIGSGDTFLIWGYLCAVCTLIVLAMTSLVGGGYWGWIYFAIPVIGFPLSWIRAKKKKEMNYCAMSYSTKSITSIWACITIVIVSYIAWCLIYWDAPAGWSGMLFLCLLLPGMGTYSVGVILKERLLKVCGMSGVILGLAYLHDICCDGAHVSVKGLIFFVVSMVFTMIIPGHYLNHKSKN